MSRKEDPVFNVRFVQLVENHACLWNSTLPAYSKKEEIQRAWQDVANEAKDTVRNCRERWRTIRSSFLRSLKISRTITGRGKRRYYLSKYLQFLIPYTKTRLKGSLGGLSIRKDVLGSSSADLPPMTRISHMPLPLVNEDTKDSATLEVAIAEENVVVSLLEEQEKQQQQQQHNQQQQQQQLHLAAPTIKSEDGVSPSGGAQLDAPAQKPLATKAPNAFLSDSGRASSSVDLTEFAEWLKCRTESQRRLAALPPAPDADQSFLNSLHPFLGEMTGKQNRRFRQKVVALIDAVLDNADG